MGKVLRKRIIDEWVPTDDDLEVTVDVDEDDEEDTGSEGPAPAPVWAYFMDRTDNPSAPRRPSRSRGARTSSCRSSCS